jgi:50S ribosomal subunit-associated GTPase HflX
MLEKRRIVCVTKIDAMTEEQRAESRKLRFGGMVPHMISSVTGEGIDELVRILSRELKEWRAES